MTDPRSRWSDPEVARQILESTHVWAVVGCSPDPMRASYGVSRTLMGYGYEMIPIYPRETTIHGIATVPDLATAAAATSGRTARSRWSTSSAPRIAPGRTSTRRSPSAPGRSGCSWTCGTRRPPSVRLPPACWW